jgi:hypothetical protein
LAAVAALPNKVGVLELLAVLVVGAIAALLCREHLDRETMAVLLITEMVVPEAAVLVPLVGTKMDLMQVETAE